MANLAHLSTDVLHRITHFSDGIAIARLLLCGSRLLSTKLYHTMDEIVVSLPRFSPFPFSVLQFPQLRRFIVSMMEPYEFYPLRLNNRPILAPGPLNSLRDIQLHFEQSFSIFGSVNAPVHLSAVVPNLTHLVLGGTKEPICDHMLRNLPAGLKRFSLSTKSTFALYIAYRDIFPLPAQLEEFYIHSAIQIEQPTIKDDYRGIVWPETLKTLHVHRFADSSILFQLPPKLETLNIAWTDMDEPRILYSRLPRSLTSLTFKSSHAYTVVLDIPLNPAMTYFSAYNISAPLPEERKSEYEANDDEPFPNLTLLPSSMQSFVPFRFFKTKKLISRLPESMRTLSIDTSMLWMIEILPKNLVSLCLPLSTTGRVPVELLPQSLELLTTRLESGEAMARLPRKLKSLSLSFDSDVRITATELSGLPNTLEDLSIKFDHVTRSDALAALPSSLKTLRVYASEGSSGLKDVGTYLPRSITSLKLSISDLNGLWPKWVLQACERGLPLQVLDVSPSTLARTTASFDPAFLSRLPSTLLSLHVHASHNWTNQPECLHRLPPHLHSLHILPSSTTSPPLLHDAHFSKLPHTLTHLKVPTDRSLTPKFWSLIPRGLIYVSCGPLTASDAFLAARRAYFAGEGWPMDISKT